MRTLRATSTLVALAASACVLLAPSPAGASSPYPATVQSALKLAAAPGCTLCHASAAGGGIASKPFGVSMKSAGMTGGGATGSVTSALTKLETNKTDSDKDCVDDVTELKAGKDPNSAADQPGACGDAGPGGADGGPTTPDTAVPLTEYYGCSASPGASGAGGDLGAFGAAAIAVLGAISARRRRRR